MQHSPQLVLTSANGVNYFLLNFWIESPSPGRPSSQSHLGQNPNAAGDDALSMSTARTFQVMHRNKFLWRPQDQIQPFVHHFIPEMVHWV